MREAMYKGDRSPYADWDFNAEVTEEERRGLTGKRVG